MKKGTKQLSVDCILWATAITVFVIANDNDVCEQLISMEKSRKLITQRLKIPLLKTENNNSHTHSCTHKATTTTTTAAKTLLPMNSCHHLCEFIKLEQIK